MSDFGIGELVGLGIDLATTDWKYKKQREQEKKLQDIHIQGSKEMGLFNTGLQKEAALDMWNKTNVEAQRKHIENAGLNVGLMYGGSGGGGTTIGASTGNVGSSGASEPNTGMGMQLALAAKQANANIELTKAQTNKTNIEAEKIAGVDTTEANSRIAKLAQETKNAEVEQWTKEYEKKIKGIEATAAEQNLEHVITQMATETDILLQKLEQEKFNTSAQSQDFKELREQVKQNTIEQAARIIALKENTEWQYGSTAQKERWIKMATNAVGAVTGAVNITK